MKDPAGCLLITPESLVGLLMREGNALGHLFGGLRYIVVDELHAFLESDRGKQLQSLLNRIDLALDRRVPRIALSATLGEMSLAAEFLRPDSGGDVDIIETKDSGQELKVVVRSYLNLPPQVTDKEAAAKEKAGETVEKEDLLSPAVLAITDQLYQTLRGSNNLVFPNARNRVELYADLLRRTCERNCVPNEFWPHHGSLSKEIREDAERALKSKERSATGIATTTLELGIDIGAVKSIAQIGPAPSVASLRQRLGRSGRRKGEPAILRCYCIEEPLAPDLPMSDRLREGLVQTIAQVRLLVDRWFEPPRTQALHLSTLVQQLLSLIAQYGGITAASAYSKLCTSGVFQAITKQDFVLLLRELGEREFLMQESGSGVLLHGPAGEKVVNHYSFLAAFVSADEFRVLCDGHFIGTLPIDRPLLAESYLILAGRRWQVIECSQQEKVITVRPAKGGKLPTFDGLGGKVHDRVRAEMRAILAGEALIGFVDSTAAMQLGEAREAYTSLELATRAILSEGHTVRLFTWRGDWVNDTLALLLTSRGLRAQNEGLSIGVTGPNATVAAVHDALLDLADAPAPRPEQLAAGVQNKFLGKWDGVLPSDLLRRNFASAQLDVTGAVEFCKRLIPTLARA